MVSTDAIGFLHDNETVPVKILFQNPQYMLNIKDKHICFPKYRKIPIFFSNEPRIHSQIRCRMPFFFFQIEVPECFAVGLSQNMEIKVGHIFKVFSFLRFS